jgi:hypothetical protein
MLLGRVPTPRLSGNADGQPRRRHALARCGISLLFCQFGFLDSTVLCGCRTAALGTLDTSALRCSVLHCAPDRVNAEVPWGLGSTGEHPREVNESEPCSRGDGLRAVPSARLPARPTVVASDRPNREAELAAGLLLWHLLAHAGQSLRFARRRFNSPERTRSCASSA